MAKVITEKRRRIALHEAGHAVVAHALGYELDLIRLNSERNGVCCTSAPDSATDMDEVTVDAAGYVAMRLFDGKPVTTWRDRCAYLDDLNGAADLIDAAGVLEPTGPVVVGVGCRIYRKRISADLTVGQLTQLAKAERRAARILRKRWRAVEALAEALVKMYRRGPQATAIIERALSEEAAG